MINRDLIETVVVTGASAGVGRAIAVEFGSRGCRVGLIARGREGLESTCREITRRGGEALVIEADVADAGAMMTAAARVEAELGPIDLWVNNAMVTVYGASVDVSPEEFLQVTRVSYLGQVHGTLAALRHMRPRNRGAIISIGSALAYRSIPYQAPYCAAKAATRGFIDSLRSELEAESSGITLTMVHLPAVNTPQFDWARNKFNRRPAPVAPIYQPEAIAAAVVRAAERAPREYWVGASAVKAIIGQIVMPSVVDRMLAKAGIANETSNQPDDPNRADNLFVAGRGDPGAHGRFDRQSLSAAFPFNPTLLRAGVAVGAAAAGLALLAAVARTERRGGNHPRAPRLLSANAR
ncbi:MAG: SDR family oxidoreductase [Rhodopseudomonas sp.]|uniref:SDR family oxidoreductase n=1 Tax=Rhodopseudomonas sp. TaxID=1078 RepID=UPI0039E3C416